MLGIMKVITVKRLVRRDKCDRKTKFSDLGRHYFESEWKWHFVVEALLFAAIGLACAGPLASAADAVSVFLQQT